MHEVDSLHWLHQMQEMMPLEGDTNAMFDDFVDTITKMSMHESTGLKFSAEELCEELWQSIGNECMLAPDIPDHFLYVHLKKTDKDTVTVTVGNTGQGVQGLDPTSKKYDLLQRYEVTRNEGEGEKDPAFKVRVQGMIDTLQESRSNGEIGQDANVFMTEILEDVFFKSEAIKEVFSKRKPQTIGNCGMKGLIKNFLWQRCVDKGRPDIYYAIMEQLCETLKPVFEGAEKGDKQVMKRINERIAQVQEKKESNKKK